MNKKTKTYALVTGSSKGFGKCLALELAKRKINTILVALPHESIQTVAEQCESFHTESHYRETDLSQKKNVLAFTNWVNKNFNVNILINNAGCGGSGSFLQSSADYIDNIIQINIMATSLITHQLLPNLLKQKESYILNVSSIISFSPSGYKTVYPASKRFIYNFTRSLSQELKNTNVFLSVVHPGQMKTNGEVTRRIEKQGIWGRIGILAPEKVAELTIDRLFKKKQVILPGWINFFYWMMMSIIPARIRLPFLTKIFRRETNLKFKKSYAYYTGNRGKQLAGNKYHH